MFKGIFHKSSHHQCAQGPFPAPQTAYEASQLVLSPLLQNIKSRTPLCVSPIL